MMVILYGTANNGNGDGNGGWEEKDKKLQNHYSLRINKEVMGTCKLLGIAVLGGKNWNKRQKLE